MKKKKILFAAVDVGYRIEYYSRFIDSTLADQLEAESFSKYQVPESHYKTQYTHVCPIDKRSKAYVYFYSFWFFIYALFRYDIFHFFSGETILTRKLRRFEFAIYKLFGKRIVMQFVGADIRSPKYLEWKVKNLLADRSSKDAPPISEPFQVRLIEDVRKYASCILVSTPDLLSIVPEATYFPVTLEPETILSDLKKDKAQREESEPGKKIRILHSPSSLRTKGSEYIHQVLDKLAAKFPEQIEIVTPGKKASGPYAYSLTRYELLKEISAADIIIDQMVIGWYGLLSVEALFLEKKVICHIDPNLIKYLFPGCPIVNSNITSLEGDISRIISKDLNKADLAQQRAWVEKYHTLANHTELVKSWGI